MLAATEVLTLVYQTVPAPPAPPRPLDKLDQLLDTFIMMLLQTMLEWLQCTGSPPPWTMSTFSLNTNSLSSSSRAGRASVCSEDVLLLLKKRLRDIIMNRWRLPDTIMNK